MTIVPVEWRADMPDNCEAIEYGYERLSDSELLFSRINVDNYAKLPMEAYDGWSMSGRGVASNSLCGVPIASFRTEEVNEHGVEDRVWRYHNCKVQGCPECYRVWSSRAAKRAATYICGGATEYDMTLYHAVLSADPGYSFSREGLMEAVDNMLHAAHDWTRGLLGYVAVIHPYRLRCRKWDAKHQKYYDTHGDYDVNPKAKCPTCGEVDYGWLPGLHVHLITNFYVSDHEKAKALRKQIGLRYANISQDKRGRFLFAAKKAGWADDGNGVWHDPVTGEKHLCPPGYLASYLDVFKVLRYELTHCEWRPGKSPIKYAGLFRRGTYKVIESKSHWEPMVSSRSTEFYKEEARPAGKHVMAIKSNPSDVMSTSLVYNLAGKPIKLKHRVIDEVDVVVAGKWDITFKSNSGPRFVRFPKKPDPPPESASPTLRAYQKLLACSKELEDRVMGKLPMSKIIGHDDLGRAVYE